MEHQSEPRPPPSDLHLFNPATPPPPGTLTVREICQRFIDEKELQSLAGAYDARSLKTLRWYLGSFCKMFGDLTWPECRNADLTRWLLAHPEWKSANTRADAIGRVVSCFRWAEGDGDLIDASPYRRTKRIIGKARPREALTSKEFWAVMDWAKSCDGSTRRARPSRKQFRHLLWFLWQTGARTCEAREVAWTDLDWSGEIRLAEHKTSGTTDEARVIGLHDGVLRLLRQLYRFRRANQTLIFVNGRGRAWTKDTFAKMFRKYADLAGVRRDVSAYCCRHGFTVEAIERGLSNRQIADLLGHKTTRYVDQVYGRCSRTKGIYLRDMAKKVRQKRLGNQRPH